MMLLIKYCPRCRQSKEIEGNFRSRPDRPHLYEAYCFECYRLYRNQQNKLKRKERTATAKRWIASNPEKRAAHIAVFCALRNGTLVKQPCEVCGSLRSETHHEDYSKPLEVQWLCRKHHLKVQWVSDLA